MYHCILPLSSTRYPPHCTVIRTFNYLFIVVRTLLCKCNTNARHTDVMMQSNFKDFTTFSNRISFSLYHQTSSGNSITCTICISNGKIPSSTKPLLTENKMTSLAIKNKEKKKGLHSILSIILHQATNSTWVMPRLSRANKSPNALIFCSHDEDNRGQTLFPY